MEAQGQKDVQEIWRIIRRRKWAFLLPALLVFITVSAIALLLPPIYKSTSTILIEEQQIPPEYVKTTVTGYVEERLQMITQEILSYANLIRLIQEFDLYPELRDRYTLEEIADRMRDHIKMETISAEVSNSRGGRPQAVTVAFTISFEGRDPVKVQKVTNALASLYLEYNLRSRRERATATTIFLEEEAKALKKRLEDLETRISRFKKEHFGELPEMVSVNLQALQRLERRLEDLNTQIRSLEQQKVYLQGQLALVEPLAPIKTEEGKTVMNPLERLKYLRLKLVSLQATLSPNHPDIQKLQEEIWALEAQVGQTDDTLEKIKQLNNLQARLAEMRTRLGPKHPDVLKLERDIEALSREISQNSTRVQAAQTALNQPDNPAYINLMTQIASLDVQIKNLKEEKARLEEKIEEYQKRLEKAPLVEKEYKILLTDYENTRRKYDELMSKLMEARIAQKLEESQGGERFTIIDPARLPEKPYKPKRAAIILIGFVLALGSGVACVALLEYLDTSVKTPEELRRLTGASVVSVLPYIETLEEVRARKRRRYLLMAGLGLVFLLGLLAFHLWVMPFDLFWIKLQKKLTLIWG